MRNSLFSRVNTFLLILLVLMAGSIMAMLARGAIGGPLDPPGTPGPTLSQVEPRSPVPPVGWNGSFPIVLSSGGSYYLTKDLVSFPASSDGIEIQAPYTTLDLNGFSVRGISPGNGVSGIKVDATASNVTIENGTVQGWQWGINAPVNQMYIHDVNASSNQTRGIEVGDYARVMNVTANSNGNVGVFVYSGSLVSRVIAENNPTGIAVSDPNNRYAGGLIEYSTVNRNGTDLTSEAISIWANNVTVSRNVVDSSYARGIAAYGAFDVITDNTVQGATTCIYVNSNNTVARNIVGNCSVSTFAAPYGSRFGPLTTDLTSTQPWSNVAYP